MRITNVPLSVLLVALCHPLAACTVSADPGARRAEQDSTSGRKSDHGEAEPTAEGYQEQTARLLHDEGLLPVTVTTKRTTSGGFVLGSEDRLVSSQRLWEAMGLLFGTSTFLDHILPGYKAIQNNSNSTAGGAPPSELSVSFIMTTGLWQAIPISGTSMAVELDLMHLPFDTVDEGRETEFAAVAIAHELGHLVAFQNHLFQGHKRFVNS